MHQRCVRWPARARAPSACCPVCAAQCVLPSVSCPVWAAQYVVPSACCPVWGAQCPVKGHYWTPGAGRKKGGWLGRPGQARPQGSRTSQGSGRATFHSSFSFNIFLLFLPLIQLQRFCFLSPNHLRRRVRGHSPGTVVYPSTGRSLLWKCFPPPTSNKYWKRFLSSATDQKTMEDKGTDGRRRHGPEDQK